MDGPREAELTALFVDEAPAGQMLLDALSAHARDRGVQRLVAFPPHHFHSPIASYNAGWGGLSDRLGLVAQLLARNGFTPFFRELHLEWTDAHNVPMPPRDLRGITIDTRRTTNGRAVIAALISDEEAGQCDYSLLTRISDDPEARRWGYIWGLDVQENMRRRGIARVLVSSVLAELSSQGCHGCWLTTEVTNWPAQALYLALGFEVVDASTCFARDFPSPT